MSYAKIGSEPGYSIETRPPQSWPDKGSLKIKQLSLAYYEGGPCVLKDITFNTYEREKIGVVGRTGAGKSSLVSALFRMPEPSGKVIVLYIFKSHWFQFGKKAAKLRLLVTKMSQL